MRTFEIEKASNSVRIVNTVPWLNEPVISGELIYEINYIGNFTYRLIDHYTKAFSIKFDIVNSVFTNKIVSNGNRVAIL